MKILIASVLLATLGFGSYQLASSSAAPAAAHSCDAKVTCTGENTCRIDFTGPDGKTCWVELACDGDTCRVIDSDCSDCSMSSCSTPCATPCGVK